MSELAPGVGWLRPLQNSWPGAVVRLLEGSPAVVRVVIASMRGSAPREAGACLLITPGAMEGTIGGGHLEFEAIQYARSLLHEDEGAPAVQIRQLILGRDLRQCCGGSVQLWMERFTVNDLPLLQAAAHAAQSSDSAMLESDFDGVRVTRWLIDAKSPESMRLLKSIAATHRQEEGARKRNVVHQLHPKQSTSEVAPSIADSGDTGVFPSLQFTPSTSHAGTLLEKLSSPKQALWLFGAGHVGQAIVRALSDLPFDITWVDSRNGVLPTSLPTNVRRICDPQPAQLLSDAPPRAMFLVLTHDHALDYALCHAILQRGAFAWLGLIGSESKAASFRSRLRKDGIEPRLIERLICPIGIHGIESKMPAAIAVAVAAQLLQQVANDATASTAPGARGQDEMRGEQGRHGEREIRTEPAPRGEWEVRNEPAPRGEWAMRSEATAPGAPELRVACDENCERCGRKA